MKNIKELLEEYFIQEYYIKLNTQLNDEGNMLIFLSEPSEENYNVYVNNIAECLDNEMITDYDIDGDYEGIIEIYLT
jgi:hypothetical protein